MPDKPDQDLTSADAAAFAKDFQDAVQQGGFNPFQLLTGARQYHGVFLAPFSRELQKAVDAYLRDGTGPLLSLVEQFRKQGADEQRAREQVRGMLHSAVGMCVTVLADDQGPISIPQLFFGSLEDDWRKHAVELCGKDFPDADGLKASLLGLKSLHASGKRWPRLYIAGDGDEDAASFWLDLAELVLEGRDEGLFAAAADRGADLAHWAVHACLTLLGEGAVSLDADALFQLARCALIAGEADTACLLMQRLLADGEVEDEALAVFLEQLTDTAIAKDLAAPALAFVRAHREQLAAILGGAWELALPVFRLHAAAEVSTEELLAAAEALQKADRKSFRHAMGREPLWRVGAPVADLIDTQEAANLLERSVNFVAKRLEQGTIPFRRDGEQVRIPRGALLRWKAVMERHSLLE